MINIPLEKDISLDIPDLIVTSVRRPADNGKYLVFQAIPSLEYRKSCSCIYCKSQNIIANGFQHKPRLVHDVSRNGFRIDIVVFTPMNSCRDCKGKYSVPIPGVVEGRMMTKRLEEELRRECFLQPLTTLSERSGLSITTIEEILDEEIKRYDEYREEHPLTAPKVLGIDEKHTGHKAHGTLVDIENGHLLDMVEGNSEAFMVPAIKKLKDWDKNIKFVTLDMHHPYFNWLETLLPNATLIVDKYHFIQDIQRKISKSRKELIKYRKMELKKIKDAEERARQSAILRIATADPRLFSYSMDRILRNGSGLKEKLTTVIDAFPEFKLLHNYYYSIQRMYMMQTREEAEEVWADWLNILPPGTNKEYAQWCEKKGFPPECFEEFRSFSRQGFQKFAPYILNYFNPDARRTNAVTEGLNSLIEDISIAGKGYSFRRLRGKCLYASLIRERIHYSIDLSTVTRVNTSTNKLFNKWEFIDPSKPYKLRVGTETLICTKFMLSEETRHISIPPLSVYGDSSWLYECLSDEYATTKKEFDERYLLGNSRRRDVGEEEDPTFFEIEFQ